MKVVYVTDLDGTLLNNKGELSEFTKVTINSLIEEGMNFSFATARSGSLGYSALKLMNDININAPVFLMQGALTYDYHTRSYIDCNAFSNAVLEKVIKLFKNNEIPIFLYGMINNKLTIFYEELSTYLINLYEEWNKEYQVNFIKVSCIEKVKNHNIWYFFTVNSYENLKRVNELLTQFDILSVAFFDANRKDQGHHLECLNKSVSKYEVVMNLKNKYGFEKVIGFGDSLNDIPLSLHYRIQQPSVKD